MTEKSKKKMPIGKRFVKGQSGNPAGYKPPPALTALRKITIDTYREVIEITLTGTVKDLERLSEDPNASAIQVGIAVSFLKAIKAGDWTIIEKIAERIVGKIPDQLSVTAKAQHRITTIDKEALAKAMRELESEI